MEIQRHLAANDSQQTENAFIASKQVYTVRQYRQIIHNGQIRRASAVKTSLLGDHQ